MHEEVDLLGILGSLATMNPGKLPDFQDVQWFGVSLP